MKIKLTPKTKFGKDRVAQHGNVFSVLEKRMWNGQMSFLVESENETLSVSTPDGTRMKIKNTRWVQENDKDFFWEKM